jgi:hypothetical protein
VQDDPRAATSAVARFIVQHPDSDIAEAAGFFSRNVRSDSDEK